MKKIGFSHIRRWLLIYAIIFVFISLATYLYVYNEFLNILSANDDAALGTVVGGALSKSSAAFLPGIKLRISLLLSISFLIVFLLSWLWMHIAMRQINRPIFTIQRAVNRLAQGKLNETVALESSDELGQIGAGINELAANLQELLLHIWKQTGKCIAILDHLKIDANQSDGNQNAHLLELAAAVESLREMAKAYVFYDVRLDGEQTLAINEPGQKENSTAAPSQNSLSD